jgi:hypothetical protein
MIDQSEWWNHLLEKARSAAERSGRNDVAEYLHLRITNDQIRQAGIRWLTELLIEIAGEASRSHPSLAIEREVPHSFVRGHSTMVGEKIDIRLGVRCLTCEAGWARAPQHGIMRGRSLAAARLSHFGMPRATEEYRLVPAGEVGLWVDQKDHEVGRTHLQRHVALLVEG